MVQFLSIFFFLGFLQSLLGFSKVPFLCHPVLRCTDPWTSKLSKVWLRGTKWTSHPQNLIFKFNTSTPEMNLNTGHKFNVYSHRRSGDSSVGIVTLLRTGWGIVVLFLLRKIIQTGPRVHLAFLLNGYRGAVSLGIKRQRREAEHLPPSNAEI